MSFDANHRVGMLCSRYGCSAVSIADTPAGAMCEQHREPLMFQVQLRRRREQLLVPRRTTVGRRWRGSPSAGGVTFIAAEQLGRVALGIEIDPRHVDATRRRWARFARDRGIDPGAGALEAQ